MTDMRERLIAMATYGSSYRGSGSAMERAATAERLVLEVERHAVARVLDKARTWHEQGTLTDAEWSAVCAVFYVDDVRPAPERIARIVWHRRMRMCETGVAYCSSARPAGPQGRRVRLVLP